NQHLGLTAGGLLSDKCSFVRHARLKEGLNVRPDSSDSRTLASAGGRADRAACVDPAPAAHAVGLLLRARTAVARHLEDPLPGVPGPAGRRGGLVHPALHLYAAVPLGARAVHSDDDADVVGCRARRLALLGG